MKLSTKIIIGVGLVVLASLVITIVIMVAKNRKLTAEALTPASQFVWRYENGSKDLDGFPKTQIFMDVSYENGKVISKKIDEVQGSCNAIDSSNDRDKVNGATKIQCYAAGFGEWYKIVMSEQSYKVMRKNFAEAEPDIVPPNYQYEVVAEIPLVQ